MKLDEKYSIIYDGANNFTLTFQEEREVKKKDGTKEMGIYKEEYFRPNIHSALRLYLDKCLEPAQDTIDCCKLIEETYSKIEKLKWKQ